MRKLAGTRSVAGLLCAGLVSAAVFAQDDAPGEAPVAAGGVSSTAPAPGRDYDDALEPQRIVVEATRIATPVENVASSVTVTSSQSAIFEARQYRRANEVLATTPGVSIRTSGGGGSSSSVFIRGLPSEYTKVVRDGMPVNDPSTTKGSFDFGDFALDGMGQLEVLRGPQSMLHGSAGVGGVVNYVTKKGEGPLTGFVSTEAGSRGTVMSRLGLSAGTDKVDFTLGGSVTHTDGISNQSRDQFGMPRFDERDSYDQGNVALRLGANASENLRFDLFANAQVSEVDLDGSYSDSNYVPANNFWGDSYPFDDPNIKQRNERFMIRPQATLSLLDGRWEQKVGFGYAQTIRKVKDAADDVPARYPGVPMFWNSAQRNRYEGYSTKFDYQSVFHIHETNSILAGVDVTSEWMKTQSVWYGPATTPKSKFGTVTTTGVFLEDQIAICDTFFATLGVRNDHHDEFGDHLTWRASAMYKFPTGTKLKASAGTGFRAPGLYELYGDGGAWTLPNTDLDPEKSFGWDVGFEQTLFCERLTFGATFFQNRVKNMIDYEDLGFYTGRYVNIGKARTYGVESFLNFMITDNLSLSAQYTWLQARNEVTRERLLRRPVNEASLNVDWRFLGKGTLSPGIKYVGRRDDGNWNANYPLAKVRMPSYMTARVAVSWKFNDHVEVFGRVENIFNKKYEDVFGYGTERRSFDAGAAVPF